jgi:hypothetical protein
MLRFTVNYLDDPSNPSGADRVSILLKGGALFYFDML